MKYLAKIKPEGNGEVVFGKLPIFTRNLKKVLGDKFSTRVEKLDIIGRYFAAELSEKPKTDSSTDLAQALEEDNSVLSKLTKNGEFVQVKKSYTVDKPADDTTEEKSKPSISQYQVGRARFAELKKLAENGELDSCKNRLDICEKLGYEKTRHNPCYSWLAAQINKGRLKEELVKYNGQNAGEYHYSLTGEEPVYSGNKLEGKSISKPKPKPKTQLTELGFVNLASKPAEKKPKKSTPTNKSLERGDLSLFDWLNRQDYLIYMMFVYGNGQVAMDKYVDYEDVCAVFREAGLISAVKGVQTPKGVVTAQNTASMCLALLQRMGILQKSIESDGTRIYTLSVQKGGQYARSVYRTVSEGKYKWDSKRYQRTLL